VRTALRLIGHEALAAAILSLCLTLGWLWWRRRPFWLRRLCRLFYRDRALLSVGLAHGPQLLSLALHNGGLRFERVSNMETPDTIVNVPPIDGIGHRPLLFDSAVWDSHSSCSIRRCRPPMGIPHRFSENSMISCGTPRLACPATCN